MHVEHGMACLTRHEINFCKHMLRLEAACRRPVFTRVDVCAYAYGRRLLVRLMVAHRAYLKVLTRCLTSDQGYRRGWENEGLVGCSPG